MHTIDEKDMLLYMYLIIYVFDVFFQLVNYQYYIHMHDQLTTLTHSNIIEIS